MLTQQPFIADDLPARELLSLKKACMVFYDASGALAWQDLEVLNPFKKPPPFSAGWSNWYVMWLFEMPWVEIMENYMDVSENSGTPKWMVCNGKPY